VILPATYSAALLLMFACMFCWGSWPNTLKLSGRWRFELFYYDYALGIALCAAIAAFSLGSFNSQDLTFQDNFLIASTRKIVYAFAAGMLLNIANLFFTSSFSVSAMALTFPVSMALTVVTTSIWNYFPGAQGNPLLLFGGMVCLVASVVLSASAHSSHAESLIPAKPVRPDPRAAEASRPASTGVGVVLAVLSGIVMGLTLPLLDFLRSGENGVSSYGIGLLLAAGIFISTFLFVPFFLNFPVQGAPVEFRAYFKGSKKQHFWGVFGGIVWMAGTTCYLAGIGTATLSAVNTSVNFGVVYAAAWVGALWGLLAWREYRGSAYRVKMLLLGMFVLYAAGVGMVALVPLFGK
jgi:glucose uptake protein